MKVSVAVLGPQVPPDVKVIADHKEEKGLGVIKEAKDQWVHQVNVAFLAELEILDNQVKME